MVWKIVRCEFRYWTSQWVVRVVNEQGDADWAGAHCRTLEKAENLRWFLNSKAGVQTLPGF